MRLALAFGTLLASPAMAGDLRVVTDLPAVHSVTEMILGAGTASLLLPPGGDPHHMTLKPSDASRLAEADLVIWAGPETSPWLERALAASGAAHLALGDDDGHGDHDDHDDHGHDDHDHGKDQDDHGHEDDHAHGAAHPWLDPHMVAGWAEAIGAALSAADPDGAAEYAARATAAADRIEAAEAEAQALLAPVAGRALVVQHDAYAEFAEVFGLTIAGAITDSEGDSAGARRIAELRALVASGEVACVFSEAGHDDGLIATVTEGVDVPQGVLDPVGLTLAAGPDLYPALILGLAREIAECAAG